MTYPTKTILICFQSFRIVAQVVGLTMWIVTTGVDVETVVLVTFLGGMAILLQIKLW
jgi:hypothetical protein